MIDLGQATWTVARAGGFLAYGLLTASVVVGLVLGLGWRSRLVTRFVTTETHRFITLVGLVFVGIHGVALALDPFIGFVPLEILVPGLSHYRPLWVALGIVGGWLALAIWASGYARPRIGYRWWRRFHVLAFAAWALATVHGIGTGSDTRAPWALAIYGVSLVLVVGLLALRLRPRLADRLRPVRPLVAAGAILAALGLVAWTAAGPLQPGWNEIANNGNGNGAAANGAAVDAARAVAGSAAKAGAPQPAPQRLAAQSFRTRMAASYVTSDDGTRLLIEGTLGSAAGARFQLVVPAQLGGSPTGTIRIRTTAGATCVGSVVDLQPGQATATCTDGTGTAWTIGMQLALQRDGTLAGIVVGQPGGSSS